MPFDIDMVGRVGERSIGLTIATDARVIGLSGPSGAGKTSILNMIAGLLPPDSGHIRVAGRTMFDSARGIDIAPEQRRIGYVFQDTRLFPHLRVRGNLLFASRKQDGARKAFDDVVGMLGLKDLLHRWPTTLSGGERQRVAIGRALLARSDVLLLDEPLASVDPVRRAEVLAMLIRLREECDKPMVFVSHDRADLDRLAEQVVAV